MAGLDYWLASPLRRFIGATVFHAVLIDRRPEMRTEDPVEQMARALDEGASLILFPEGTRNMTDTPLLPFTQRALPPGGRRPEVDLVPVWIENLNRVMPKGEDRPDPADLHRHLRRADPRFAGRGADGLPRPRVRRASGPPARAGERVR